jgi:hypothetical protein
MFKITAFFIATLFSRVYVSGDMLLNVEDTRMTGSFH